MFLNQDNKNSIVNKFQNVLIENNQRFLNFAQNNIIDEIVDEFLYKIKSLKNEPFVIGKINNKMDEIEMSDIKISGEINDTEPKFKVEFVGGNNFEILKKQELKKFLENVLIFRKKNEEINIFPKEMSRIVMEFGFGGEISEDRKVIFKLTDLTDNFYKKNEPCDDTCSISKSKKLKL